MDHGMVNYCKKLGCGSGFCPRARKVKCWTNCGKPYDHLSRICNSQHQVLCVCVCVHVYVRGWGGGSILVLSKDNVHIESFVEVIFSHTKQKKSTLPHLPIHQVKGHHGRKHDVMRRAHELKKSDIVSCSVAKDEHPPFSVYRLVPPKNRVHQTE